jgi:hypothetical protein
LIKRIKAAVRQHCGPLWTVSAALDDRLKKATTYGGNI